MVKISIKTMVYIIILFQLFGCPPPSITPPPIDHSTCKPNEDVKQTTKTLIKDHDSLEQVEKTFYTKENERGDIITEGDILLLTKEHIIDGKAVAVPLNGQLWPNGEVPFILAPRAISQRGKIFEAIEIWETQTEGRIQFTEGQWNSDGFAEFNGIELRNYVVFGSGRNECSSYVGAIGGEQWITISPECSLGNTVHEIGHVLGLWHEQSRADRDLFVEVLWCNIEEEYRYNFLIEPASTAVDIGNYDFNSIMHYPADGFSINEEPTLVSLVPNQSIPEFRDETPSVGDISAINCLYDPTITCDFRRKSAENRELDKALRMLLLGK